MKRNQSGLSFIKIVIVLAIIASLAFFTLDPDAMSKFEKNNPVTLVKKRLKKLKTDLDQQTIDNMKRKDEAWENIEK